MKHKLLFFDIDGTLVSEKTHLIPDSALTALKEAQKNGHYIIINTGRPYASVPTAIRELGYDGIICGCGTYIQWHNEILLHHTLPSSIVHNIVLYSQKCHVYPLLEGKDAVYFDPDNQYQHVRQIKENFIRQNPQIPHSWFEEDIHFDKLTVWHDEKSDFTTFKNLLKEDFNFIERDRHFGEFVPHGYTKATGIQFLMNYLSVKHDDTYCFGDSTNDLPMLEYVSHSVAMKNSNPVIFDKVEFITKDVDDDGIAYALKHYHLI